MQQFWQYKKFKAIEIGNFLLIKSILRVREEKRIHSQGLFLSTGITTLHRMHLQWEKKCISAF